MNRLTRVQIAARVAQDIEDGLVVNLGIGMPELVADQIPENREIIFHSENGVLGLGPKPNDDEIDPDLINAGKKPVTIVSGASFFHQADSFAMIRGGHIDLSILGAFQVSVEGDLANWATSDLKSAPSVGGAMDLAIGAKKIFVMMQHCSSNGEPKLVDECTYPLTGSGVVKRIYTDIAVIEIGDFGFIAIEVIKGLGETELSEITGAQIQFADDWRVLRPKLGYTERFK